MKTTPPRHIVALVIFLVFLLTGQAGAQGYVWCLGEDGHAALEYAAGDKCRPTVQPQNKSCHPEEIPDFSPHEEHCGPCYDIPASFDITARQNHDQKDLSAQIDLPATLRAPPLPVSVKAPVTNLYSQPPLRISSTILAHRTVVLLN